MYRVTGTHQQLVPLTAAAVEHHTPAERVQAQASTLVPGKHRGPERGGQQMQGPCRQASPVADLQQSMHQVQDVGGLAVVGGTGQEQERGARARVWVPPTPWVVGPVQQQLPAIRHVEQLAAQSSGQEAPECWV